MAAARSATSRFASSLQRVAFPYDAALHVQERTPLATRDARRSTHDGHAARYVDLSPDVPI
jgi:hypothetical protein